MKLKILFSALLGLLMTGVHAQDRTTVSVTGPEISDNLDLRAVASIFGDSKNLEDFENRLNDPNNQISNLDLNGDNQVDYLRVIETVEGNTHIIVLQSVLGRDMFQDVASIEVEKDRNNRVQVQVVGDVYMYGNNYIYEPVYVHTPVIYTHFWAPRYRPYFSSWYWGYYPSYYVAWHPFPIFRYRSHIALHINLGHHYNYVNYRRCQVAYNSYYTRRANSYERQYPTRSFASRNTGYTNRYELDRTRNTRSVSNNRSQLTDDGSRNSATRSEGRSGGNTMGSIGTRDNNARNTSRDNTLRSNPGREAQSGQTRSNPSETRSNSDRRNNTVGVTGYENTRSNGRSERAAATPRVNTNRSNAAGRSESVSRPREQRQASMGQQSSPSRSNESRSSQGGGQSRGGGESRGASRR